MELNVFSAVLGVFPALSWAQSYLLATAALLASTLQVQPALQYLTIRVYLTNFLSQLITHVQAAYSTV